jgi:hypothetical protein
LNQSKGLKIKKHLLMTETPPNLSVDDEREYRHLRLEASRFVGHSEKHVGIIHDSLADIHNLLQIDEALATLHTIKYAVDTYIKYNIALKRGNTLEVIDDPNARLARFIKYHTEDKSRCKE